MVFAWKVQDASKTLDFAGVFLDSGGEKGINTSEAGVLREGFLPGLWRGRLRRPGL